MAFVSTGWKYSITLIDNGRNKTTKKYDLTAANAADATTDSALLQISLIGVTDARIVSYHVYEEFADDTLVLPASGVHVEDIALLSFTPQSDPTKAATHAIPAPKPIIFNTLSGAGANIVNTAQAALAAYAAKFITGANRIATLSDGETMASIDSGKRIHRGSRRG